MQIMRHMLLYCLALSECHLAFHINDAPQFHIHLVLQLPPLDEGAAI
jgi:hypothetical protein